MASFNNRLRYLPALHRKSETDRRGRKLLLWTQQQPYRIARRQGRRIKVSRKEQ